MNLAFAKDVYLVDGKARSCIYDLNAGKLYSINHLLAEKLHDICDKGQFDISVDEISKYIITHYLNEEKLVKTFSDYLKSELK